MIFGAGAVGLLCAAACKYRNVAKVVMVDVNKDRLEFAMANGFADAVVVSDGKRYETTEEKLVAARETAKSCRMELTDGADACFECTGVEGCAQAAIFVSDAFQVAVFWHRVCRILLLQNHADMVARK